MINCVQIHVWLISLDYVEMKKLNLRWQNVFEDVMLVWTLIITKEQGEQISKLKWYNFSLDV